MLESIEKARQIGAFCLERMGDYVELAFIEIEISVSDMRARILNIAISIVFLFLTLFFLGLAVIITFWNSADRTLVAWLVFAVYFLVAGGCYMAFRKLGEHGGKQDGIREELKKDIQMLKDKLAR